jgi:hypothetical protein
MKDICRWIGLHGWVTIYGVKAVPRYYRLLLVDINQK